MPATLLALQVFLILLPGFAAAYFVQALTTRRTQTDFDKVVEAIVFSFVIYVSFVVLNAGRLPFRIDDATSNHPGESIAWEVRGIILLSAVTAVFAVLAVLYVRFDGNRIFRFLNLTERTTHNSIWNDILEHEAIQNQPVQVEIADGRNILGVLLYYSDASEEASVYLTQASWVDSKGQTIPIPGPGILLTKNSGIRCLSLLSPLE